MINNKHDIAVIGGGVIGMTIAHKLAKAGREVVLIEPDEPGMGASFGNAGTIADYATVPLGTPNALRNLPDLMRNRESPPVHSLHYPARLTAMAGAIRLPEPAGAKSRKRKASEVLELEPGLQAFAGGAHYFPNATSIDDPGAPATA